jgi:hypothetical protein
MSSSNTPDKKLSGTQDATTEPTTTDATALTRPTDTPSPAFRADREHSERADSLDDRSALVRALSGLLHALVQADTESSIHPRAVLDVVTDVFEVFKDEHRIIELFNPLHYPS